MEALEYKKRAGTSGISGHLYETKLIALVLFRLLHDEDIQEFYLASNVDEIGAFDDICFKAKITARDRPLMVFIQAKHKENEDTLLNFDLIKNFYDSYVKVKEKIYTAKDTDEFYNEKYDDVDCVFVLYTNAKWHNDSLNSASEQMKRSYRSDIADKLDAILATGEEVKQGSHAEYNNEDLELVNKIILEQEINALAEHFAKFLNDNANQSMNILLDKHIMKYHVILAEKVVNVSEVQNDEKKPESKWRTLTFRSDFYNTNDTILTILRKKIFELIVNSQTKKKVNSKVETRANKLNTTSEEATVSILISKFLSQPTALNLSPLIGTHIIFKNGKLKFTVQRSSDDIQKLNQIKFSLSTVEDATAIAAKKLLLSLKLKVPVAFGNTDLIIRGSNIEKRLDFLTNIIVDLCKKLKLEHSFKIVTIERGMGDGLLSANGGIGSAIGNLFVYDRATKLLKISDNYSLLGYNSKALFDKLNSRIDNLDKYRFDATSIITFPKLAFDYTDEVVAILNKVIVYEKQSSHNGVEEILKREIEHHQRISGQHQISIKSDTILLYFHNEIQKWWMSPKTSTYFTKSSFFNQVIHSIVKEPQISEMQSTFYMNTIQYFRYNFKENAMVYLRSISLHCTSHIVIQSDIAIMTTMKVIQYVKNNYNSYAVLDLDCMLNFPTEEFSRLCEEIRNTKRVLIVTSISVFEVTRMNQTLHSRFNELARVTEDKTVILIANNNLFRMIQQYFSFIKYEERHSLDHFTLESRLDIVNEASVIYQGQKVNLDLLVDDVSARFIKGAVLSKIIRKKTITLGEQLTNDEYEKIKHFCIDRRVRQYSVTGHVIRTFYDIDKNIVLLTAKPGMGKSTLLTHLSLATKKINKKVWIQRINLLDYSEDFAKWPENINQIDTLLSLKFICRVILKNSSMAICLEEVDNKVYLADTLADEWGTFELNMFLHYYNEGNVILLFDGFDEICPNYKRKVIQFFNFVLIDRRTNRMWVTSRSYIEILPYLEQSLGRAYELDYINKIEQNTYLNSVWYEKLNFSKLSNDQLNNMITFLHFVPERLPTDHYYDVAKFRVIYDHFYKYVHSHFPHVDVVSTSTNDAVDTTLDAVNSESDTFSVKTEKEYDASDELLGNPLILYLVAEYFVNVMSQSTYKLPKNINIFSIYKTFIDTQLKICSEDKSKMDLHNPSIIKRYEQDRIKCIEMHKKLAACAVFKNVLFDDDLFEEFRDMRPFNNGTFEECTAMLIELRSGSDKTGLISHVTQIDIPVFIHQTFAEYFASEYISDIFKSSKFDFKTKALLYSALIFSVREVMAWVERKMEIDTELNYIIKGIDEYQNKTEEIVQSFFIAVVLHFNDNLSYQQKARILNSTLDDYEPGCFDDYSVEYLDNELEQLDEEEKFKQMNDIVTKVVAKMKPPLKKYFTKVSVSEPVAEPVADSDIFNTPQRSNRGTTFDELGNILSSSSSSKACVANTKSLLGETTTILREILLDDTDSDDS